MFTRTCLSFLDAPATCFHFTRIMVYDVDFNVSCCSAVIPPFAPLVYTSLFFVCFFMCFNGSICLQYVMSIMSRTLRLFSLLYD